MSERSSATLGENRATFEMILGPAKGWLGFTRCCHVVDDGAHRFEPPIVAADDQRDMHRPLPYHCPINLPPADLLELVLLLARRASSGAPK